MGIRIEDGGMFTTVQDEGRYGYQQFGMTTAGPMDRYSFHLANILVSNPKEEAALEISLIGPKIRVEKDNVVAVTGGDLGPLLNGKPAPMYQAFSVRPAYFLWYEKRLPELYCFRRRPGCPRGDGKSCDFGEK